MPIREQCCFFIGDVLALAQYHACSHQLHLWDPFHKILAFQNGSAENVKKSTGYSLFNHPMELTLAS